MRSCLILFLAAVTWDTCSQSSLADIPTDEKILRDAKVGTDDLALLNFLRKHTPAIDPKTIESLIRKLGSDDFAEREKAMRDVLTLGPRAAVFLRSALQDPDPELAGRAKRCLQIIDAGPGPNVQAAAVRLLAERKPADATSVLLQYFPYVPNEAVAKSVQQSLFALALRDGKPEPALLAALEDKLPGRRQVAAEALLRAGAPLAHMVPLLDDADLPVRLSVALAMIERKEKRAVPVLIDLLAKLPAEDIGPIEEVLYRLAGNQAPVARLGSDGSPEKSRAAWATWWKDNEAKIAMTRPEDAVKPLGYTLILSMEEGKIAEIQTDGKVRWQFEGLSYPMTAQVLDKDRVLIAEYRGMRVTERDFAAKILWEKKVAWPVAAQRFPDGHTFIATRTALLELDKDGKEIYVHQLPGQIIMAAQKLRNGNIGCMTSAGIFLLLDSKGKEIRKLQVGAVNFGSGLEVLPNGNVLVPEYRGNQVVEWNVQGKKVWSANLPGPQAAFRLANGNTLMASATRRQVVEVDSAGRTVWEFKTEFVPARVQRR